MADNKKYYYLKLKENFYDSEEMIILQNMQDGYLYSDILMKLYLRSLKNGGELMFKDMIPYTPSVLAQVVRHQVGTVEKALAIFQQLGLIEVLDNGAIFMSDIQNFIGESSTEADRKRQYRSRIDAEKTALLEDVGQMSGQMYTINRDRDKDKDRVKDKDKEKDIKHKYGTYQHVLLTNEQYEKLKQDFPTKYEKLINDLDEGIELKGYSYKNHYLAIRKWEARDKERSNTPYRKQGFDEDYVNERNKRMLERYAKLEQQEQEKKVDVNAQARLRDMTKNLF
jgi:predicted phage replisome organizer